VKQTPIILALAASTAAIAGGCRSTSSAGGGEQEHQRASAPAKVSGEATYLVRMAVPEQALLIVRLEDVSVADAAAAVLGEQVIEMQGRQVPIPFEIAFDPARIDDGHVYVVRASIQVDERLMFVSTQAHPVLTQGSPATIQVLMQPVRSQQPIPAASPLVGTYWKLTALGGAPAIDSESGSEPHLVLEPEERRFLGSGGVNSLSGTYALDGQRLTLAPGPMTLMAGPPEAMAQEQTFVEALRSVTSFRIAGDGLALLAGEVAVLEFEAVQLP
jgi:putative lipoprotein